MTQTSAIIAHGDVITPSRVRSYVWVKQQYLTCSQTRIGVRTAAKKVLGYPTSPEHGLMRAPHEWCRSTSSRSNKVRHRDLFRQSGHYGAAVGAGFRFGTGPAQHPLSA